MRLACNMSLAGTNDGASPTYERRLRRAAGPWPWQEEYCARPGQAVPLQPFARRGARQYLFSKLETADLSPGLTDRCGFGGLLPLRLSRTNW